MHEKGSMRQSGENFRYSIPSKTSFSKWWCSTLKKAHMISCCLGAKGDYVLLSECCQLLERISHELEKHMYEYGYSKLCIPAVIERKLYSEGFNFAQLFGSRITSKSTTEPIFMLLAKEEIRTYKGLPLKMFHTSHLIRVSKRTLPLIKERTIHAMNEAYSFYEVGNSDYHELMRMRELFEIFFSSLRIPYITLESPPWHNFPGSKTKVKSLSILPNKRVTTIADLGLFADRFTKSYDVTYTDSRGRSRHPFQNSYAVSIDRVLGVILATYGDDRGLVLPPHIATTQIVIVPVFNNSNLLDESKRLGDSLSGYFRITVDDSNDSIGMKRYKWELKGVPLRVELGNIELKLDTVSVTRRDTKSTAIFPRQDLVHTLSDLLDEIDLNLFKRANKKFQEQIFFSKDIKKLKAKKDRYVVVSTLWNGSQDHGKELERLLGLTMIGYSLNKDNSTVAYFSRKT
jgi:prolyl-tRNA synthetase